MNKKVMFYIIGIILIGIIIISIVLTDIKKSDKKIQTTTNPEIVTSEAMYYTIQSNIQKYITFANVDVNKKSEENALGGRRTTAEVFRLYTEEDKKRAIMDFIDKDFIQKNNINEGNIDQYVKVTANGVQTCDIDNIKMKQGENGIEFYAIDVTWKDKAQENIEGEGNDEETSENKDTISNEKFIVKIDKNNKTYSVKPTEELDLKQEKDYKPIEKNTRNTYTELTLNDGEIAKRYLERYTNMMINNPEKAYEYLDEEYRNERFENVENFKNYIKEFEDEISGLNTVQFIAEEKDNYKEYVCKDQYENLTIFDVRSVLDFIVKLDNHTILSEGNKKIYEKASDSEKVKLNIDRFIDMANTRDYHTIYKKMDEGFKEKYKVTEEKLTQYFKEYYFPKHYTYKVNNIDKQSDVYIAEIYLYEKGTEQKDENYSNKIQLMIQLKEGMDYNISLGYVNF